MSSLTKILRHTTRSYPRRIAPSISSIRCSAIVEATSSRLVPIGASNNCFSTMSVTKAAATVPSSSQREYDPEIKAIADYVHNYKVDSDLAVSRNNNLTSSH